MRSPNSIPSSGSTSTWTLHEAGPLRTWLLKPAADGTAALDDQFVNGALAKLGRTTQLLATAGLGCASYAGNPAAVKGTSCRERHDARELAA